jgi:subtilisin family serine protease
MPGDKHLEVIRALSTDTLNDPVGHGSCVASKVAGPKFGVAKNANLVMFKVPFPLITSDIFTALVRVYARVVGGNLKGKAVLNLSLGCKYINPSVGEPGLTLTLGLLNPPDQSMPAIQTWIRRLIEQDVVIVAASGNTRVREF